MYQENSFITLTYSEENLPSERLQYADFQRFIKDLRSSRYSNLLTRTYPGLGTDQARREAYQKETKERRIEIYEPIKISVFVCGEYGDRNGRPHWHAIIFNWRPQDLTPKGENHRGDKTYYSKELDTLWGKGRTEVGSVTFESAGYVARYAAKKLSHGKDGTHDREPIAKTSSRNAIGKKWLEKNWKDVFLRGELSLGEGIKTSIPRYYEKWLQKHHEPEWTHYVTEIKPQKRREAEERESKITLEEKRVNLKRSGLKGLQIHRNVTRKRILEQKFEKLKKLTKL